MASIMRFNEDGTRDFIDYGPAPENERDRGMPMRRIVSVLHIGRFIHTDREIGRCGRAVFHVGLVEEYISFAYREVAIRPSASTPNFDFFDAYIHFDIVLNFYFTQDELSIQ